MKSLHRNTIWMEDTCHRESGFWLVTWSSPGWHDDFEMANLSEWDINISLQLNYRNGKTYISSLFVWSWTALSHTGNEYFSCGPNESFHNIVTGTPMIGGNWKSGHALTVTTSFCNWSRFHKRWRNKFHDFYFHFFSSSSPQNWLGMRKANSSLVCPLWGISSEFIPLPGEIKGVREG